MQKLAKKLHSADGKVIEDTHEAIERINQGDFAMISDYDTFQGKWISLIFGQSIGTVSAMIKVNPCDFYQIGGKLMEWNTAAAIEQSISII